MSKEKRASVFFDYKTQEFANLTEEVLQDLHKTYPNVDITKELMKMKMWLLDNKSKKRQGTIGFVVNWLDNASPKFSSVNEQLSYLETPGPLADLLQDYLRKLWNKKDHLFVFNTIH